MGHKNHEHHHQQPHHKEMESNNVPSGIPYSVTTSTYKLNESEYERERKDEKLHKHMGHLGKWEQRLPERAFVMHEKHQVKKDPEHAERHKMQEKIAVTVAIGVGGYVVHEHHKREEFKKRANEAHGKKHHHHLF